MFDLKPFLNNSVYVKNFRRQNKVDGYMQYYLNTA